MENQKIIMIPIWSVKRKPFFKGIVKYYAYAVGNGLGIFKSAEDFKSDKGRWYLEKKELVQEAESEVKRRFHFQVSTLYKQAYKNKKIELFSSNERWHSSNTKEDLWYFFKDDSEASAYIYRFLRDKFFIKKMTYRLFCRMIEVEFVELDVTDYEREYSEFRIENSTRERKNQERKISAGVVCAICGSEKTMVVKFSRNEFEETRISCRKCGNIWGINPYRK